MTAIVYSSHRFYYTIFCELHITCFVLSEKKSFPKILTAVVAAPLLEDENHRHYVWNKKLSLLSFYDAIIVHSYAKVVKGKDQYGQMILEEDEGEMTGIFVSCDLFE